MRNRYTNRNTLFHFHLWLLLDHNQAAGIWRHLPNPYHRKRCHGKYIYKDFYFLFAGLEAVYRHGSIIALRYFNVCAWPFGWGFSNPVVQLRLLFGFWENGIAYIPFPTLVMGFHRRFSVVLFNH